MRRTEVLQETRKMRFGEVYGGWKEGRLTQEQAALALGVCSRTFRRYLCRYEEDGPEGLLDKRITQASFRRAPVDEVLQVTKDYETAHQGWSVKHFHSWYKRDGGQRSYTWVKKTLQSRGLVPKGSQRGVHRKRREPSPLPGMMLLQDGSTHEWVPGKKWDLISTMDDATNEQYSMFFVHEEGTHSSFQGVQEVMDKRGLFSSFYTDRGSHYWITPEAGGKVSKTQLTQFGRAMNQLGVQMIPSYCPEARGRIERAFRTHQDRLPKELAHHGITTIEEANRYLSHVYLPVFNAEFMRPAAQEGTAFIPWVGPDIHDILCEHHQRVVTKDNCVSFEGKTLQIPPDQYRCHYVKATVRVHRYIDGSTAIFHGPRKLAEYDNQGKIKETNNDRAA
jgi:hypothetical protein